MKARLNVIFLFPCVVSVSQLIKAALTWKVARPRDIKPAVFHSRQSPTVFTQADLDRGRGSRQVIVRATQTKKQEHLVTFGFTRTASFPVSGKQMAMFPLSILIGPTSKVIFWGFLTQKCMHIYNSLVLCRLYICILGCTLKDKHRMIFIFCVNHTICNNDALFLSILINSIMTRDTCIVSTY